MKTLLLIALLALETGFAFWLGWHIRDQQISASVCEENLDR